MDEEKWYDVIRNIDGTHRDLTPHEEANRWCLFEASTFRDHAEHRRVWVRGFDFARRTQEETK